MVTASPAQITFSATVANVSSNQAGVVLNNTATLDHSNAAGVAQPPLTAADDVTVIKPVLTLVKTASPGTYDAVDDVINYSYLLTNSGAVPLSGPFTVDDDKATVTCPPAVTSLAPGATLTCTASYTVSQGELDTGSVKNTAQGHGFFGGTPVDSNSDDETVTAIQTPALTVEKSSATTSLAAPGTVTYSYLVKNTGNVTLTGVSLADDNIDAGHELPGHHPDGSAGAPGQA